MELQCRKIQYINTVVKLRVVVQLQEPLVKTVQNTAQQLHFIEKSQRQRTSEVWTTIKLVKPQQLKFDELVKALGEHRVLLEQS